MELYEITIRIYIIKDVPVPLIYGVMANYIDSYLAGDKHFYDFHQETKTKAYCFDLPIKIEKGMKVYKGDQVYQFRIRTVDKELLSYLMDGIADHKTDTVKGLMRTVRQIPERPIASVYSLTPVILKSSGGGGYWRDRVSLEGFEQELTSGLIHQYEVYMGEKVKENLTLYDQIELKNKCAIGVSYKGITLLGDKIAMQISDDVEAQKVMRFALANGAGTMSPRGMGYVGFRFL